MGPGSPENTGHAITVCTSCHMVGQKSRPGRQLIERLRAGLAGSHGISSAQFTVSGIACMAGCERPCTVAFQGAGKATYLFGNVETEADTEALVAFAHQYAALEDGWCSATQRPAGLSGKTLARVPSSLAAVGGT